MTTNITQAMSRSTMKLRVTPVVNLETYIGARRMTPASRTLFQVLPLSAVHAPNVFKSSVASGTVRPNRENGMLFINGS
jgi:hypothetical protein